MIVWISKPLALAIHDRQLAEYGGSDGLRDDHLLESALGKPQQLHAYGDPAPDLADLAASLAYGIARNYPFVDGNKRTATVCCETFVELNGAVVGVDDAEFFTAILGLAGGKLKQSEFAAWLRLHTHRKDGTIGVQEPTKAYRERS